jgi:hypothetical protein
VVEDFLYHCVLFDDRYEPPVGQPVDATVTRGAALEEGSEPFVEPGGHIGKVSSFFCKYQVFTRWAETGPSGHLFNPTSIQFSRFRPQSEHSKL